MSRPNTEVRIAFNLAAGGRGDFFTLGDATKGVLNGATFKLAGDVLQDVTEDVQSIRVRRGRSKELDSYQAGAADVQLDSAGRKYDPAAGTAITPYGSSMRPRKEINVSTAGQRIFSGVVEDWDLTYQLDGGHVTSVKCTDGFVFLANQEIEPHTTTSEKTGARIASILDRSEISWPNGKRDIDDGIATLQADSIGGTADPAPVNALKYLQQVQQAEQGALFIDAAGALTFKDRESLQVLTDVVFTDEGDGIPFSNIEASYGGEAIRNAISVSRLNGGTVTATDNDSIDEYGRVSFDLSNTLLVDDTEAQTVADILLSRYKEPRLRISALDVIANALSDEQLNDVLALDLGDRVTIDFTPSGIGDKISEGLVVESIEHTIDPTQHRMRFSFFEPFLLELSGSVTGVSTSVGTVVGGPLFFGAASGSSSPAGSVVGQRGEFGTASGSQSSGGTVTGTVTQNFVLNTSELNGTDRLA